MREQYVEVDGVRTRYFEAGSGAVVVLLHGASLAIDARVTWYRTIPYLARRYRVLAPDLVGFGGTGGRHVNRLERRLHAIGFIRALGLSEVALVGHSEGGFIGTLLAIEHPQLVRKVAIVTSGATSPRLGGDADAGWMTAANAAYDYLSGSCDTEEEFIQTNSILSTTNPPDFIAVMRENYALAIARGQLQQFQELQAEATAYGKLQEDYVFPHMASIEAELMLIWARQDATVPVERGLRLLDMAPRAEMHVFNGAAHMVMIDRAAEFNRLLSWWIGA